MINAGMGMFVPVRDVTPEQWDQVHDINLRGAFFAAQKALPLMGKGGSIVFTSGIAGQRPHTGWALGASITSAMEGLTRALAVELAPIRVNIVSPGVVKTPLWSAMPAAARPRLPKRSCTRAARCTRQAA